MIETSSETRINWNLIICTADWQIKESNGMVTHGNTSVVNVPAYHESFEIRSFHVCRCHVLLYTIQKREMAAVIVTSETN